LRRLLIVAAAFVAASNAATASAACVPPAFEIGQSVSETQSLVILNVSVQPIDFTRQRLVCLAEVLRQRYREASRISVLIFSSPEAARDYTVVRGDDAPPVHGRYDASANVIRQLHASYEYSSEDSENFIVLKPLGNDRGGPFDTRIDLPVTAPTKCDYEIRSRCLVALDEVVYPIEALLAHTVAAVPLTATIDKDGAVINVREAGSAKGRSPAESVLAQEAAENLRTWRFEASQHIDRLRVIYRYQINGTVPPRGGSVRVTLRLPSQVVVQGGD
jgi:hypothetical protein